MGRADTNPPTFIGPLTPEKSGPRPWRWYFLILQAGPGLLKLEYHDKTAAGEARQQLLLSTHTHKVPSNKLLAAICEALNLHSGETSSD